MRITRRNLLKRFLILPIAAASGAALKQGEAASKPVALRCYLLNRFSIAGFQYYQGPALVCRRAGPGGIPLLDIGSNLDLIPEPKNRYDEFAVLIEYYGVKVGYVPRSDNRHISRLLRQDARLYCRAIDVNPEAGPWGMVRVEVGMVS